MANYLERVASSAGRRAAIANPPASAPPLLPASRDLSLPAERSLPSDDDQFFAEADHINPERPNSSRSEELSTITPTASRARNEVTAEPRATEPPSKPATSEKLLSRESLFTVQLPKTLRPITTAKIPPSVANDAGDRARSPAPVNAVAKEITADEESGKVIRSSDLTVQESMRLEVDTDRPPARTVADPSDELQSPTRRQIRTKPAVTETPPIRPLDRDDRPGKIPAHSRSHRDEPLPTAMPVPIPVVVASAARPEQSRISIGSLEVMVNNHPPVATVRPSTSAPSRGEKVNLERRYLDRFRLRH